MRVEINFELGELEALLADIDRAETLFEASDDRIALAQFLHNTGAMLAELGVRTAALEYFERADELTAGTRYNSMTAEALDQLRMEIQLDRGAGDEESIAFAAARLNPAAPLQDPFATANYIGALLNSRSPGENAEGLELLSRHWRELLEPLGLTRMLGLAIGVVNFFDDESVAIPTDFVSQVESLSGVVESSDDTTDVVRYLTAVAVARLGSGDVKGGLRLATEAVGLGTVRLASLASAGVRRSLLEEMDNARVVALTAASRHDDSRALAEIIENARLQTTPDRVAGVNEPGSTRSGQLLALGHRQLARLAFVSVGGVSALASAVGEVLDPPDVVAFEDQWPELASEGAEWLGLWFGAGWSFCAYRDASGTWSHKSCHVEKHEELYRLINTFAELGGDIFLESTTIDAGLGSGPAAESQGMVKLGEALLPGPLLERMVTVGNDVRDGVAEPVRLFLTADRLMGTLPIQLLGAHSLRGDIRLLEYAVVHVAPPTAIRKAATERHRVPTLTEGGGREVVLLCADPDGSLEHSRHRPVDSHFTMTSSKNLGSAEFSGAMVASRANFVTAIAEGGRRAGSALVYMGHAAPSEPWDPYAGGLVLDDGLLTAADLLEVMADSTTPSTVFVSACSAAGADSAAVGEWFGLGATFLLLGTSSVVATGWPILDTPFVRELETEVAVAIAGGEPVADALRSLQLSALGRWRNQSGGLMERLDPPTPMQWASYYVMSA